MRAPNVSSMELAKGTAQWHLSEAVDWRAPAIFWRNLKKTPWYAWPALALFVVGMTVGTAWWHSGGGMFYWSVPLVASVLLRRRADQHIELMSQTDSPVPQLPVDIVLYYGKGRYGEDSGLITFCDGWMLFEGEATSFSITHADVEITTSSNSKRGKLPDPRYGHWMSFVVNQHRYMLGIHPLNEMSTVDGHLRSDLKRLFASEIREWVSRKVPDGVSVYPPVVEHPSARYRMKMLCLSVGLSSAVTWMLVRFHRHDFSHFLNEVITQLGVYSFVFSMYCVYRIIRDAYALWRLRQAGESPSPRNSRPLKSCFCNPRATIEVEGDEPQDVRNT